MRMGDFRLENQRVDFPFRCLGGARQLVLCAVDGGSFASQRDGAAYALPVVHLFEFSGDWRKSMKKIRFDGMLLTICDINNLARGARHLAFLPLAEAQP